MSDATTVPNEKSITTGPDDFDRPDITSGLDVHERAFARAQQHQIQRSKAQFLCRHPEHLRNPHYIQQIFPESPSEGFEPAEILNYPITETSGSRRFYLAGIGGLGGSLAKSLEINLEINPLNYTLLTQLGLVVVDAPSSTMSGVSVDAESDRKKEEKKSERAIKAEIKEGLRECTEEGVRLPNKVIKAARAMILEAHKAFPRTYYVYPFDGSLAVEAQDQQKNSVLILFEADGQIACLSNIDGKPARFRAKTADTRPSVFDVWLNALSSLGPDVE